MSRRDHVRTTHAADGDEGFSALFAEVFPLAYRVAYRLLGDAQSAEDVAAEALARAYAQWASIRNVDYQTAWVLRVTSNLALSLLRRKPAPQPAAGWDAHEDATATRLALVTALSALPKRQREVIVLHHLAGYSEPEVAGALGLSINTVKTHLQRGINALRGSGSARGGFDVV